MSEKTSWQYAALKIGATTNHCRGVSLAFRLGGIFLSGASPKTSESTPASRQASAAGTADGRRGGVDE
ncbi:hypothetical protein [Pimelobacter simplex]|uniref:hypothetical protein n=1 Tax=Nocardioides simplex TaxID=2045 RepID=UPI001932A1B9|nr:hypothetical protein [Pimelobacter simplex]